MKPQAKPKPLNVLLVEDSVTDAKLISFELKRGGYDVRYERVDSEDQYLYALDRESWDLIISDYSMPKFDGLQAFRLHQERGSDTPFIFVSGALGEERAVAAMRAGARDYILKGDLGRLNAAVQRELDEARNRRQARAANVENAREHARLALALQATGAGVFEYRIPADGSCYYNRRIADMLGYPHGTLPRFADFAQWLLEQVHPDDRKRATCAHSRFVGGRTEELSLECRVRHRDGSWRVLACLAAATSRDEAGFATELVGVLLDRTRERFLEESHRQGQGSEAVGRLAGSVALDFNNLLNIISNSSERVLNELPAGSQAREDMHDVLRAAKRAGELTSRLLAYARIQPNAPTVQNVNERIAGLEELLVRLLGDNVQLRTDPGHDLWNVRIDPAALDQVIANLAVNARDAMPGGGTLRIGTMNLAVSAPQAESLGLPAGEYVAVRACDDGIGMSEQSRAQLVESDASSGETWRGAGMGLAACYGIVKQAGGYIRVHSRPGQGTAITLLLPRAQDPRFADLDAAPADPQDS